MTRRINRLAPPVALVLVVGAALSTLAACDSDTDTARAVRAASIELAALTQDGNPPASAEKATEIATKIVADLKPVADKGTPAENAAASVLLSQAQSAIAEAPAAEAFALERENLVEITRARAALGKWSASSALAGAYAQYDPSAELADIDKQVQDRQALIQGAQRKKADVEGQVARLRAQARGKVDEAQTLRQREGGLMQKIANSTEVEGLELMKQVVEVRRQADALEMAGANLDAEAARIAPQVDEIQLEIGRLTSQVELFARSRSEVNARDASAKEQTAAARSDASTVAQEIHDLVRTMGERRSGPLDAAMERALTGYGEAVASARKSVAENKVAGNMALGAALQGEGEVHWARAQGLGTQAAVLESLATAQPALPHAADYAAAKAALSEQQKASLDAATASFSGAKEAYEKVGTARERIDSLNRQLGEIVYKTSGGSLDIRSVPEAPDRPERGGDPSADAGDMPGPAVTIDAMLQAVKAGQYGSVMQYLHVEDPENQKVLDSLAGAVDATGRLDAACREKFGKGLIELSLEQAASAGSVPVLPQGIDAQTWVNNFTTTMETTTWSDFTYNVNGDTAEVLSPTVPGAQRDGSPIPMKQIDGQWLIDLSEAEQMLAANPDAQKYRDLIAFAAPLFGQAMTELAGEVQDGKYATPDVFLSAMQLKQQPLMFQILGKMQELGINMPGGGVPPPPPPPGGGG